MQAAKAERYPDPQGICDVAGNLKKILPNRWKILGEDLKQRNQNQTRYWKEFTNMMFKISC